MTIPSVAFGDSSPCQGEPLGVQIAGRREDKMEQIVINGRQIDARVRRRHADSDWNGRESWEITAEMTAQEASGLFTDDAQWAIRRMVDGEILDTDLSEFSVAGPIIDHRDGTVTAKMGKLTDREALEIIMGGMQRETG